MKNMNIDFPNKLTVPALRSLWKEAFGDSDGFIDAFMNEAFSPKRCRCAFADGKLCGALYWFDCSFMGERVAYLYAVATAKAHRGKGVASSLMKNTHEYLKSQGYSIAVLVPGTKELFDFYQKLGYKTCAYVSEINCKASENSVRVRKIEAEEYKNLRKKMLPLSSVIQENENISFLKTQAEFYTGTDFLLTARKEGNKLFGAELLGNTKRAPEILCALGFAEGKFRTPGEDVPFAMGIRLDEKTRALPSYFGLAFD